MKDFKKVLQGSVDKDSELGKDLVNAKMMYHESDLDFTSQNRYFVRDFKVSA
jgi:hypothetical protein